jgi:VWFA-related protein
MKCRFAVLLLWALTAVGQTPRLVHVDVVVTDSAGNPVPNLTAADFEILQDGKPRKISNFTYFDTRRHTAFVGDGVSPALALDLKPDEIRRNLVLLVDDSGLALEAGNTLRRTLGNFVDQDMRPGDQAVILRTSSGMGAWQQFTSDKRLLHAAIDRIVYLGAPPGEEARGAATIDTLRFLLDGLADLPGRKSVVLFSGNLPWLASPGERGPRASDVLGLAKLAHESNAVFYAVDPSGKAEGKSGLVQLAADTGGLFGVDLERVLRDQDAFYVIGFSMDDPPGLDEVKKQAPPRPAEVRVLRPGIRVRSRLGFLAETFPVPSIRPRQKAYLMERALNSPFAAAGIRLGLTALVSNSITDGSFVEALVHVDARDLTVTHELNGLHHVSADVVMVSIPVNGPPVNSSGHSYTASLKDDEYQWALRNGLSYSMKLPAPAPGLYQVRVAVGDGPADRFGSATRLVEVPDIAGGRFAISGIALRREPETAPNETPVVLTFRPGATIRYDYTLFNSTVGTDKRCQIEVQTRIFAGGRAFYDGKPVTISFDAEGDPKRRGVSGQVTLDAQSASGEYVMLVTLTDKLATREPRSATQFAEFRVR